MLRPGVFARYLDFALRNCSDEHQMEDVLFRFISVCKNVSPRVLVQLINHFRNRNNPVQLATGKANGAGSAALDREIEPISDVMCNRFARDIFNQLWQVLRAEDTEPKSIYIDPACHCNKLIFPTTRVRFLLLCGPRLVVLALSYRMVMCCVLSCIGRAMMVQTSGMASTSTFLSCSTAKRKPTSFLRRTEERTAWCNSFRR